MKRYIPVVKKYGIPDMDPNSLGAWVRHDDASAALAQRDERIAAMTKLLGDIRQACWFSIPLEAASKPLAQSIIESIDAAMKVGN